MIRFLIVLGAGAGIVLGAGVGARMWLAEAFARGEAHGRAVMAAAASEALERRRVAEAAAMARTQAEIAQLQDARDRLQETYDALERQIASTRGAGRVCLDAGLVRALDAIGADRRADAARP